MPSPEKIIIIGAGPAGLTAAYKLLQSGKNFEITILEASDAIGGISRTVCHNGNRMDIGGHRFFSKDKAVTAMWEELMPLQGAPAFDDLKLNRTIHLNAEGPDPEKEDRVMLKRNRVSRIFYRRKFFDYPVKMNFNTICNMGLWTTFVAGCSYLCSIFRKRPENSLENFYINRFGKKLYSMFFESYTEKLWGRHPRAISADWGAQRVKGLSILAVLKDIFSRIIPGVRRVGKVETSLIEEFSYPKYGPGQLWETVAAEIEKMGGRIIMNCEAQKLICDGNQIRKVICKKDGKATEFISDTVISSMPLKDLAEGLENIPEDAAEVAAGLPYRDFVTVGVLVDTLNLKNQTKLKTLNNLVPDCWIYVQDAGVKLGRIQIFNNWSPYMVADPEKTVWIGLEYFCSEGDEFWNMSDAQWKEKGVYELISMGVLSNAAVIRDFHVEKVKKAYPAYFDTYEKIDVLIRHLDSIRNLYCVGRNGQHRYNNMDHSMATAFEAVQNILNDGSADKRAIWNVNTEAEYHEEKKS